MDRKTLVLREIHRQGLGLEIGPGWAPLAPKRDGFNVEIIDHATREELVDKYRSSGAKVELIEEVDFVWRGEPFTDLTGRPKQYDWIIASHLIEHTPNLVGFLNNCSSVLKDDGVVCLIVPDARYCFDHFRPLTGLARIVDAHHQGAIRHTPGTRVEATLNAVSKGGAINWSASDEGGYQLFHEAEVARDVYEKAVTSQQYADDHAWCFSPSSFRLIIDDLRFLGLIELLERSFHPTIGFEFFVSLALSGPAQQFDRLEMLRRIEAEVMAAAGTRRARSRFGWRSRERAT